MCAWIKITDVDTLPPPFMDVLFLIGKLDKNGNIYSKICRVGFLHNDYANEEYGDIFLHNKSVSNIIKIDNNGKYYFKDNQEEHIIEAWTLLPNIPKNLDMY